MADVKSMSVSHRRSLFVWAFFCILAGLIFLAYGFASLAAGRGEFVMPLDDVYIHFQYAKQIAAGQPYVYNPGLPPTSGATSFLYPYLLAVGYLLGFQGLNLGLWAMLLGFVALTCSTWLVYRLLLTFNVPVWLAILIGMVFALSGPISWHFMSGMETGFVVLFTLWTLYTLTQADIRGTIFASTLLALIRPEMGILALLAIATLFMHRRPVGARHVMPILIPILAIGLQPLVNLLLTGSAIASGNAAKSVFGIVPFYWDEVIRRILDNFTRMWAEFLTGSSPREGLYIAPLMLVLAGMGLIVLRHRQWRIIGLMLIGWLLFGTLAISTLDTAFWHFKRYQMPFLALLFPLAGWGVMGIWRWGSQTQYVVSLRYAVYALVTVTIAIAGWTWMQFLHHYALNSLYVYQQPLQMARWLEANTLPDAVIAVHDVGMIRYLGGRTTLDIVGLTTPGAAEYWRNGPGSVAEFLIQQRPDYIASYGYGHGFGLGMLADTSLYGEPLASFPVDLDDNYNVALAANFQGIYKPDWEQIQVVMAGLQPSVWSYFSEDIIPIASLNVADIRAEQSANYSWLGNKPQAGFPTDVYEFDYWDCIVEKCHVLDGGRRINGEESFDLYFEDDPLALDLILITRVNPLNAGTIDVFVDDTFIATRWIPQMSGRWLDIPTLIPISEDTDSLNIRIKASVSNGFYFPYYHTLIQYRETSNSDNPITTFQSGAIVLAAAQMNYQPSDSQLAIDIDWYTDGSAQGDYKVFVHILDENDQIVAQTDTYPGNGTLPPGNWLPGILRDTIVVDLNNTPPGKYRVAIGLYNPYTFERLPPEGGDDQNRFFIGDVEIE